MNDEFDGLTVTVKEVGPVEAFIAFHRRAIFLLLLTAFFVGLCVRTYGFPGQSLNGGVTVSVPGFSGGVELWPHLSAFNCSDVGC